LTAPWQVPADARPAASILFLRDAPAPGSGLQVLMLVRAERGGGDIRSGAAVFPGGVLDARDRAAHAWCLGDPLTPDDATLSQRFNLAEGALDYAIAALRESFEEVGLLRACAADGSALDLAPGSALYQALQPWRERLQIDGPGRVGMAELCQTFDLRLDLRGLAYTAHWLTPPGLPKRWDTRFFAAPAPVGQEAVADGGEAVSVLWTGPQAALDGASAALPFAVGAPAGAGLKLLPAMRTMLAELAAFPNAVAALQALRGREQVSLTMPRRGASRAGARIVLPTELAYAEIARLDPPGRGDVSCELLPGRAVRLSANVWRVTAPNPGVMTGPGTNSYLVGAGEQWTVIDPGPVNDSHRQALLDAAAQAGGRITRILATHTHRDHSPGAVALAAATGAPVWGRLPLHPEWQDESFHPQHQPAHGERFEAGPGMWLRVVHTPGHASNHLCFLLEAEKLLFTGDHVMQGSTVVINPPDGDMAAYLASLQALLAEDLDWLAPGHGFLVEQPHEVLRKLIAHRLKREAKVLQALREGGPGTLAALVARVYDDAPVALHGVARRSLLAHLLKLQAEAQARCVGDEEAAGGNEGGKEGGGAGEASRWMASA
jgi:glyoxylase-like metal-dependent hydrolase (beta-lactamase superfamily II)/8-oxo-dGTP pyrophosphatase MutT (NUDIX family)